MPIFDYYNQRNYFSVKNNNSKFEKYDIGQISYEIMKDYSNIRQDKDNDFLERVKFDSLKRNNKNKIVNKLVEKNKCKLDEPQRVKAFKRLMNDANRRIYEKKQKENLEELSKYKDLYNDKKYNEEEWNEIYKKRFKNFEDNKNKKIEMNKQKKKIQKMIEEEEEINMCKIIKMPEIKQDDFFFSLVKLAKQEVVPIKTKKRRDLDDLVYALERIAGKYKNGGILKAQNGASISQTDKFAGPTYNIEDRSKWLLPALSLARFGINSHFQNKYNRQAKQALNAARFNEQPVTLNTPDSNNPTYDRALNKLNSERSLGIKPITSDLVTNNALSNQREAQLWDRENTLLAQRSQYDHDIKNEILNIQNQNNANYINTANQNAARTASINSAIKQQDMALTQRRAQSWENLGLEMQKNLVL